MKTTLVAITCAVGACACANTNQTPANDTTTVTMTHAGLTPAVERFEACKAGWNFHVGESLFKLLTEDIGLPDHARRTAA